MDNKRILQKPLIRCKFPPIYEKRPDWGISEGNITKNKFAEGIHSKENLEVLPLKLIPDRNYCHELLELSSQ